MQHPRQTIPIFLIFLFRTENSATLIRMTLPVTGKNVRVDLLHPTFKARLEALLNNEPEIAERARILSGVRSFAEQQPFDNYGHAVDIRLYGGLKWKTFVPIAKEYGVLQTVFSPQYEAWHYQWRNSKGIFQAPAMVGEKSEAKSVKKAKVDLKGVAAAIAQLGEQVARRPLRKGSRNSAVKVVQERLAAKGYKCGFPDGVWGRKTDKAVRAYQRANGLVIDGVVGKNTWARLLK